MKQVFPMAFLPLVIVCLQVFVLVNGEPAFAAEAGANFKEVFSPGAAPVPWGDTTRDGNVNLSDLVDLGQHWDEAAGLYGMSAQEVLGQLKSHWRSEVPGLLRPTNIQDSWEQAPILGAAETLGVIAKKKAMPASEAKAFGSFLDVGFGVSFNSKVDAEWKPANRLYPSTNIEPVNRTNELQGYALDTSEGEVPRFNYVESKKWTSEFFNSYDEEADFKGINVNLEARYALYSGSVSADYAKKQYKNSRLFKYAGKLHKDFGWFYVPRANIVLDPGVAEDLNSPNPEHARGLYGTHYVYAKHLYAELTIEVIIKTAFAKDRTDFGLDVEAAYSGGTTSVDFALATESLATTLNESISTSFIIEQKGGPDTLMVDGEEVSFPVAFKADDATLSSKLEAFIAAWDAATIPGTSSVPVTDYYLRPLTDFLPDSTLLPFSREANLREWFRKFNEASRNFKFYDEIYNRADQLFEPSFRYLLLTKLPVGLPGGSVLGYVEHRTTQLSDLLASLLDEGRKVYTDEVSSFNPSEDRWEVPSVVIPRPGIHPDGPEFFQSSTWAQPFSIENNPEVKEGFTSANSFRVEIVDPHNYLCDSPGGNCTNTTEPLNIESGAVNYSSDLNKTTFTGRGEPNSDAVNPRIGLTVVLKDTAFSSTPLVIDYYCITDECAPGILTIPQGLEESLYGTLDNPKY